MGSGISRGVNTQLVFKYQKAEVGEPPQHVGQGPVITRGGIKASQPLLTPLTGGGRGVLCFPRLEGQGAASTWDSHCWEGDAGH